VFGLEQTTWEAAGEASRGWRIGPGSFLRARATFQTRVSTEGAQNSILSGTLTFVWKHPTTVLQTTVAQIQVDRGWNLDRDVQFFADGDHGLRGYRLYAFEGDRRIVVNVEHRVFSSVEILQLFSLGAAVFVDTGTAVAPGEPLNFAALKTDAGAGLRIGIARAAFNSVLRLDAAYAFNSDPLGRHGWLVSFSSGQAF
jgi:hemolysin activation/secretion protein